MRWLIDFAAYQFFAWFHFLHIQLPVVIRQEILIFLSPLNETFLNCLSWGDSRKPLKTFGWEKARRDADDGEMP